ncbi:MAG: hypothetical protein GX325_09885 [Peptococcaceae bacterium]|nr:hypothetical protein [Peptococcaceae bacterium]
MGNRYDWLKENKNNKATTAWVYDRHYGCGWINVSQYLRDIKKMLQCLDKKYKKTG